MRALILAAGQGNRLGDLTKHRPKDLLPIVGVPLLGRILLGLKEAGIQDVWIVVRYKADLIRREFGEKYAELNIRYVYAQNWERGNLHSFLAAQGFTDSNFCFVCDDIFEVHIIKKLLGTESKALSFWELTKMDTCPTIPKCSSKMA
jgi:NDP-sugar pyrophosphorylase family protein